MKKSRVLLGAALLAATAWLWLGRVIPTGNGEAEARRGSGSGVIPGKEAAAELAPGKAADRESPEKMADAASARGTASPAPAAGQSRVLLRQPAPAVRAAEPWHAGLAPRQPLAKEKLISPPGKVHRLTVKL